LISNSTAWRLNSSLYTLFLFLSDIGFLLFSLGSRVRQIGAVSIFSPVFGIKGLVDYELVAGVLSICCMRVRTRMIGNISSEPRSKGRELFGV
jgi:hypothetical protein